MEMMEYLKRHYKIRRKNLAKKALTIPKGQVVFFGDSITEICNLNKYYKGIDCFNAGISGDSSKGLLERIEDNVLIAKPRLVVLLCGINDLGNEKRSVEETLSYYQKIVDILSKNNIKTIIQSVYPVSKEIDVYQDTIRELNQGIKSIAEAYSYEYVDIFSRILDIQKDEIISSFSDDGLHPNKEGYSNITSYLYEIIKKY